MQTLGTTTQTTDTVRYTPGVVVSTQETCSGELRWRGGVLEQAWSVHYVGTTGAIEKIAREWRPVPTVEE